MDKWLKDKESELAALDADLVALANKHPWKGVLNWLKGR
jgi:hypothetical protein